MSTLTIKQPSASYLLVPLLAVAAVVVSVAAFGDSLRYLVDRWRGQEEYSHGFLIPLISIWLLWMRRDALRASIGKPSLLGIALILVAVAMGVVGELSATW